MATIERYLIDYDIDLLLIIAEQWDQEYRTNDRGMISEDLARIMVDPENFKATWELLNPEEQAALHEVKANEGQQAFAHFTRRYGEIRAMGPARREREKPHKNPITTTEGLFYRGLIFRGFRQTPSGMQEFILVPEAFLPLIPEVGEGKVARAPGFASAPRREVTDGYETAVDDITTILAYLLIRPADVKGWMEDVPAPEIDIHLRHPEQPAYRAMLVVLAADMDLVTVNDEGTTVHKDIVRAFLEAPRSHQQRLLIEKWVSTLSFNELVFTPGLDADEWPNDPRLVRRAILEDMVDVPLGIWWNVESFIEHIKQTNPDFQRPGSDYGSWYIRDDYTDQILTGFNYWDYIEGALLNFLFKGPLRWLGIIRRGSSAFYVSDIGAALLGHQPWPSIDDGQHYIKIDKQGTIRVPVNFPRFKRLQLARFTSWIGAPGPSTYVPAKDDPDEAYYTYRLTPQAIRRVLDEGFNIARIIGYLVKESGERVPKNIISMLQRWEENSNEIVVEDVVLLDTKNFGVFDKLKNDRRIKTFLEEPVGTNSFAVKRDNLFPLLSALREAGFFPLFLGHKKDDLP